jgi:4-amino-4-deoxy-L-arabinose transferase-like glycosyltransferase
VRRVPRAARWCALVAFANALVWSLVTPPFHVPDETVHVAYVQYLAETGRVPNKPGEGVFSGQEAVLLEAVDFNGVVGRKRDRPPSRLSLQRNVERVNGAESSRVGAGGTSEATSQPPLYYAYESLGYLASPWNGLLERLWLMRVLSALLTAVTVVFVYLFLRELFPDAAWAWTVGALAVAFQPLLGFMGGGVHPDVLLFTASAALFWALARAFRQGLTRRTGAVLGAALAVGILAKLNFIAMLPGALLGVAFLVARAWRTPLRREALAGAALACGVVAAAAALYIALNLIAWDRAEWGGGVGVAARAAAGSGSHASDPISLAQHLSYTWQLYLPRLPFMEPQFAGFRPWEVWFKGFIGNFGWLDTSFHQWAYYLALAITAPIAVLAGVTLVRRRAGLRRRIPELLTYAAIVAGLLVSIGVLGLRYRRNTGFEFEQARYLLPLVALYGAGVAAAALGAGRRFGRPVGAVLVSLAAVHGLFAQLLVISRFYG